MHTDRSSSKRDPSNLDTGLAEVEQQAEPQAGYLEIVQALRQVHVVDDASVLQFDEHERFDEKIGKILADDNATVSGPSYLATIACC